MLRTQVDFWRGLNTIAYDSVVTYITLRLGVFSKALSGIFLIRFPSRNLRKKNRRTYNCFLFIQPVNKCNLKLMALKRLYTSEGVCGGGGRYLTQFYMRGSNPRSNPLPFYIPFLRYPFCILVIEKWYPFHILLCNAA